MKDYTQLTREQRYQIYALKKEGHNRTVIARNVGVHKATISRELSRNRGGRGYRPKQADELATERKQQRVRPRITSAQWTQVQDLLRQQWSPEQISGRLAIEEKARVSHERIYQYVYADKASGGDLYLNLRCQKQRRKRYGSYARRGQIPNRVLIKQLKPLPLAVVQGKGSTVRGIKMYLPRRCQSTKEIHHEQEIQKTLAYTLRV